jgi:hypothetical protein
VVSWIATGKERELLDENAFAAQYAPTGPSIFARGYDRELMAVRFDLEKLEAIGTRSSSEIPYPARHWWFDRLRVFE